MGKQVDLSELPTRKGKTKQIDWKNSIGKNIKFNYNGIIGELKIKEFLDKSTIIVEYENKDFPINQSSILKCRLGLIVGTFSKKYDYETGEIVNGYMILEQTRNSNKDKAYKVKCIKCGYVKDISESNLRKRQGCNVCLGRIAVKGINSIFDTDRWMCKYIPNEEDWYTHTSNHLVYIDFICPICGEIK